jgi:hypothetical protein
MRPMTARHAVVNAQPLCFHGTAFHRRNPRSTGRPLQRKAFFVQVDSFSMPVIQGPASYGCFLAQCRATSANFVETT